MHEVRVHFHIEAPVEQVFDAVSDHESFLRSEGGVRARVVRAGEPERNGLGCLREVRVGRRVRYVEEITAWQRPSAFEYMIRETSTGENSGSATEPVLEDRRGGSPPR